MQGHFYGQSSAKRPTQVYSIKHQHWPVRALIDQFGHQNQNKSPTASQPLRHLSPAVSLVALVPQILMTLLAALQPIHTFNYRDRAEMSTPKMFTPKKYVYCAKMITPKLSIVPECLFPKCLLLIMINKVTFVVTSLTLACILSTHVVWAV